MNDVTQQAKEKMEKALDRLKEKMKQVRTGRAHISLLDGIKVSCYGTDSDLSHVASLSCPDARTILISPWDQNVLKSIEEAIVKSSIGMAPQSDGKVIRLKVPELTEDRRQEVIRSFKKELEKSKVDLRQVRKDIKDQIKNQLKDKSISEDEARSAEDEVQKQTDHFVAQVDELGQQKEKELTQV